VQARANVGIKLFSLWNSRKDLIGKADAILEEIALAHSATYRR